MIKKWKNDKKLFLTNDMVKKLVEFICDKFTEVFKRWSYYVSSSINVKETEKE